MVTDPSTMKSAATRPPMRWATCSSAVEVKRQTAVLYALSAGWTAFDESDFPKSEALFRTVLWHDRTNPKASAGLAATYRARHLLSRSERVVTEASRSGRRDVFLDIERGWLALLWRGEPQAAQKIFDSAVEIAPTNVEARIGQVATRRHLHDTFGARRKLDEAKSRVGDPKRLFVEEGYLSIDEGRHDAALDLFLEAHDRRPGDHYAVSGASSMYRYQRRLAEARSLLDASLDQLGRDPILLDSYGWVAHDEERYEDAEEMFREVLTKEPCERLALLWLPIVLRKQRKFREAAAEIDNAFKRLRSQPVSEGMFRPFALERAWLEFDQQRYPEAEKALRMLPGGVADLESRQLLVTTLQRQKRYTDARDAVEDALLHFPRDPGLVAERSALDYLAGQYDVSLRGLRQAAATNPFHLSSLLGQSVVYRAQCQTAEAAKLVGEALTTPRWENHTAVRREYGNILYSLRLDRQAAEQFCRSLEAGLDKETLAHSTHALPHTGYVNEEAIARLIDTLPASRLENGEAVAGLIDALRCWRPSAARRIADQAKTKYLSSPLVLLASARIYEDQRDLDRMSEEVERAANAAAGNQQAQVLAIATRIRVLRTRGELDRARLDEAIDLGVAKVAEHPRAVLLHCELAFAYLQKYEYPKMLEVLDAARKSDPYDPGVRQLNCAALREMHDWQAAERCAQEALRDLPGVGGLECELGWAYYGQRRWEAAREAFERALSLDKKACEPTLSLNKVNERASVRTSEPLPDEPLRDERALVGISETLLRLRRVDDAKDLLEDDIKRNGSRYDIRLALARALREKGRLDRWNPDQGKVHEAKQNLKEAQSRFERESMQRPADTRVARMLAVTYLYLADIASSNDAAGYWDRAVATLREALARRPDESLNNTLLAWILLLKSDIYPGRKSQPADDLREAQQLCERTLLLNSQSAMGAACLGIVHWRLGHLQSAEDWLSRAAEMDSYAGYAVQRAALYLDPRVNRAEDARRILTKFLRADWLNPDAHYHLGRALRSLNRETEAADEFRQTLAIKPRWWCAAQELAVILGKSQEPSQLSEAECVLDEALSEVNGGGRPLNTEGTRMRARLASTLAWIRLRYGEATNEATLFRVALQTVEEPLAKETSRDTKHLGQPTDEAAELSWYAGLAWAKLAERNGNRLSRPAYVRKARKHLKYCHKHDEYKWEAKHYLDALPNGFLTSRTYQLLSFVATLIAVTLALTGVSMVFSGKPTGAAVSLGGGLLFGASSILPYVKSVKVAGIEAEFQQPQEDSALATTMKLGLGRVVLTPSIPSALSMTRPRDSAPKLTRMRAGIQSPSEGTKPWFTRT